MICVLLFDCDFTLAAVARGQFRVEPEDRAVGCCPLSQPLPATLFEQFEFPFPVDIYEARSSFSAQSFHSSSASVSFVDRLMESHAELRHAQQQQVEAKWKEPSDAEPEPARSEEEEQQQRDKGLVLRYLEALRGCGSHQEFAEWAMRLRCVCAKEKRMREAWMRIDWQHFLARFIFLLILLLLPLRFFFLLLPTSTNTLSILPKRSVQLVVAIGFQAGLES